MIRNVSMWETHISNLSLEVGYPDAGFNGFSQFHHLNSAELP
jgi:hypothetical protein